MKPIIIITNETVISIDKLKKYIEDAYNQGYEDGKKAGSVWYCNGNRLTDGGLYPGYMTTITCKDGSSISTTTGNNTGDKDASPTISMGTTSASTAMGTVTFNSSNSINSK
jgi:hypothetical protein